ncbi:small-conductance mechanosensitive channel [Rubidibacter lacunae KORDI 51-2]|uniref:Small-conductance mechanosensitive channel n=1 Tax=Rubidibacter lacunae KORDI 51-2 TaxID=582515 RepID=U5DDS2_9CHRO|nr:mechanosensitive ion channel family protein [Rubidibacter lacunae]ERN42658.1 small-conductance mechanosensitive channel [Rubidibacter lacunae KORDI 51-2]
MRLWAWLLAGIFLAVGLSGLPASAQVPVLPSFEFSYSETTAPGLGAFGSVCIRLDGQCLFEIAPGHSDFGARVREIQPRMNRIARAYFRSKEPSLIVRQEPAGAIVDLYVQVGDGPDVRLMSVTSEDARLTASAIPSRAEEIAERIRQGLMEARAERRPEILRRQAYIAGGVLGTTLIASLLLRRPLLRSKRSKKALEAERGFPSQPISQQLDRKRRFNVAEAAQRSLQVLHLLLWVGSAWYVLGLLPHTRPLQAWSLESLQIPLRLGLVVLATYAIARLSYAAIDRLTSALLVSERLLTPEAGLRLQLRVGTLSGVAKGAATVALAVAAAIVSLWAIGVNIAPLLAGAGIIGLALSLASQNLIRDALNGFFILLEDQYAVGDIISVGDRVGLVESINLRITQFRNSEGALITVPNGEIRAVANLSNHWSRADLKIPVAYQADIDQALNVVREVTLTLSREDPWSDLILEPPLVLGADEFGQLGVVIRVWIKTLPLKQWEVARECRRRLKIAFDSAGIQLALTQQSFWVGGKQLSKRANSSLPHGSESPIDAWVTPDEGED